MNAPVNIAELRLPPVMRIMPENVTALWPQLESLFSGALEMAGTHEPDDVRRALMTMRAQLWAQMKGNEVEAACTTEFIDYPKGMFVRVWHAGALPERRMNESAFLDLLDRWRLANGCVGFEAIGRHGWLRRFPQARAVGLIMRWTP